MSKQHRSMPPEWKDIRGTPTRMVRVEPYVEALRKESTDKRIDELNTSLSKLENKTQKALGNLSAIRKTHETLMWIDEYHSKDSTA